MSYLETVLKYELQTQKAHILKNSKVMLFLFSEAPNLKLEYFSFSSHLSITKQKFILSQAF